MSQNLVVCLSLSVLIAGSVAVLSVVAGASWWLALALYSASGSLSLVGLTLAATKAEPKLAPQGPAFA